MIVCSCNVLSDGQIRACMKAGADCPATPAQLYRCLGCGPRCGRCAKTIRAIMDEALAAAHADCQTCCSVACPLARTEPHSGAPAEISAPPHRRSLATAPRSS